MRAYFYKQDDLLIRGGVHNVFLMVNMYPLEPRRLLNAIFDLILNILDIII